MKIPYPCKDCDKRYFRCHSECEGYLEAKRVNGEQGFKGFDPTIDYEFKKKLDYISKRRRK